MARLFLSIAVCIAAISISWAGSNTTYSFLRADVSARAAAMAGSFASIQGDPNSIFYNPASLGTIDTARGSLGFVKHLMDINAGYISYTHPIKDIGNFSTGITYYNYGAFDETDELGNVLGEFSANDIALIIGYSNLLQENLHYGASTKLIYSQIADNVSTALAADLGLFFAIPESRITLGASIRNLGVQLSQFIESSEDLPLDILIGGTVIPKGLPLLLSVNFHRLNDDVEAFGDRFKAFSVGAEFTLGAAVQARVGYNNEARKDLKIGTSAGLAGFSGGLGITISQYKVDYALSSLGKIGSLHRITIGTTL